MKAARNLTIVSLLIAAVVAAFTILTPATAQSPPTAPGGVDNALDRMPEPGTNAGIDRARAVLNGFPGGLFPLDGVAATGLGRSNAGVPAIKVYVVDAQVAGQIPPAVDGVPVVAEVSGEIVALACAAGQTTSPCPRPVSIGVSTGHLVVTAGTISCRVKGDLLDALGNPGMDGVDEMYVLSNNHVYADENNATPGDPVIQPGPIDGGLSPADDIGALHDFEPIVFSTLANNVIDAAIASTTSALLGTATPPDGYGTPMSMTVAAFVGQDVQKYGRTTGQTSSTVEAIHATVNVGYDTGTARFVDQIIIRNRGSKFGAGGDSGSLVVAEGDVDDRKPVGLLFAGSRTIIIANPIDDVLSAFGVTIDGEGPCAVTEDPEITCDDGIDNDCDGLIDDADGDCCVASEAFETTCNDGVDNDCDFLTDCDDSDCSVDPACVGCSDVGDPCVSDGDCCSNKCKGKPGSKTCK